MHFMTVAVLAGLFFLPRVLFVALFAHDAPFIDDWMFLPVAARLGEAFANGELVHNEHVMLWMKLFTVVTLALSDGAYTSWPGIWALTFLPGVSAIALILHGGREGIRDGSALAIALLLALPVGGEALILSIAMHHYVGLVLVYAGVLVFSKRWSLLHALPFVALIELETATGGIFLAACALGGFAAGRVSARRAAAALAGAAVLLLSRQYLVGTERVPSDVFEILSRLRIFLIPVLPPVVAVIWGLVRARRQGLVLVTRTGAGLVLLAFAVLFLASVAVVRPHYGLRYNEYAVVGWVGAVLILFGTPGMIPDRRKTAAALLGMVLLTPATMASARFAATGLEPRLLATRAVLPEALSLAEKNPAALPAFLAAEPRLFQLDRDFMVAGLSHPEVRRMLQAHRQRAGSP